MPKIQSNNNILYDEVNGKGQPLLFIYGLGSSAWDWKLQVEEFSKIYQVITFDLRGHGQSKKNTGGYSLPMFAASTARLLQPLGIKAAYIVGLSLCGGNGLPACHWFSRASKIDADCEQYPWNDCTYFGVKGFAFIIHNVIINDLVATGSQNSYLPARQAFFSSQL